MAVTQQLLNEVDATIARVDLMLKIARGEKLPSAVESIGSFIKAQTVPKSMYPQPDVLWQGNWPASAEFGIAIKTHCRAFGNRESSWESKYFDSKHEMDAELLSLQQHIADCEWSYSATVAIYNWDLGPEYLETRHF